MEASLAAIKGHDTELHDYSCQKGNTQRGIPDGRTFGLNNGLEPQTLEESKAAQEMHDNKTRRIAGDRMNGECLKIRHRILWHIEYVQTIEGISAKNFSKTISSMLCKYPVVFSR